MVKSKIDDNFQTNVTKRITKSMAKLKGGKKKDQAVMEGFPKEEIWEQKPHRIFNLDQDDASNHTDFLVVEDGELSSNPPSPQQAQSARKRQGNKISPILGISHNPSTAKNK